MERNSLLLVGLFKVEMGFGFAGDRFPELWKTLFCCAGKGFVRICDSEHRCISDWMKSLCNEEEWNEYERQRKLNLCSFNIAVPFRI